MKKTLLLSLFLLTSCSSTDLQNKSVLSKIFKKKSNPIGEKVETNAVEVKSSNGVVMIPEYGPTKKDATAFIDKTESYGLSGLQATNTYAVDFDADGWTDLVILPEYYSRPVFFHFDSKLKKFSKHEQQPMDNFPKASYLVFADFDKDGILDVIAGTLYQKTELQQQALRIYKGSLEKNKELSYQEITNSFPSSLWGPASVSLFDYDLDGKIDLFTGNWYDFTKSPIAPVPDRLLKGNGEGFDFKTDISGALKNEYKKPKNEKLYPNARPTFSTSVCDIDQNGYPDILTVSSGGYANKLWMSMADNSGSQFFEDYAQESGYASDLEGKNDMLGGGNGFFSLCADYNNDGILDIAYGAQFHSYDLETKDHSGVLTGATRDFPPRFVRTPYDVNFNSDEWSQSDRRGIWVDYNNDGLLDLIMENSGFPPHTRLVLFEQQSNHAFEDVSDKVGINLMNPSGVTIADFNRDGEMDLVVGQTNMRDSRIKPRLYLFENHSAKKKQQSLRVYLKGKKSNLQSLGAMLLLKTNKSVRRQMVQYNYGGLPSQNEVGVHFGLGEEKPLMISLAWPISTTDKLGRESALIREYKLKKLTSKGPWEITLCENGNWFNGRSGRCQ